MLLGQTSSRIPNAIYEVLLEELEHGAHIEAFRGENPRCTTVREALARTTDT
jgi:hypothetical protein